MSIVPIRCLRSFSSAVCEFSFKQRDRLWLVAGVVVRDRELRRYPDLRFDRQRGNVCLRLRTAR